MKTGRITLSAVAVATMLFSSCFLFDKETHLDVAPGQLYGCWQKEATQEYWRYRADSTGVTWDESEDISEEESNLVYTWTINGDVLTHVFTGLQENQAVPKVYTVAAIDGTGMEWKDDYGMTYKYIKVE